MRPEVVEVCNRIENYCNEDKNEKALLLNGRWGIGKSFFVCNVLKEYLGRKEIKLCYVSLYGVSSVEEINRRLYFEYWGISANQGTVGKAKIVVTTIARIALDHVGVNADLVGKTWEEIYKITATGLLIVFDDAERSNLDTEELFGYINNLCDLDGAKVLIVADEERLKEKTKEYYCCVREKTIGDVIRFEKVGVLGVSEVIYSFSRDIHTKVFDFADENGIEMIEQVLLRNENINMRTLKYSCQKYSDIMNAINECNVRSNKELRKAFFLGLLGFSAKYLTGEYSPFPAEGSYSNELGLKGAYPLFRPCYEYVVEGKMNVDEIRRIGSAYRRFFNQTLDYAKKSEHYLTLTDYENHSDEDIIKALSGIKNEINNSSIPYCAYGTILMYVAVLQYDYGFEASITELTDDICKQLVTSQENISYRELFIDKISVSNAKGEEELKKCCKRIEKTISPIKKKKFVLEEFIDTVSKHHSDSNGIVYWINQGEWYKALVDAKPHLLNRLVEEMTRYYGGSKISDYPPEEKENLKALFDMTSAVKEFRKDRIGRKHIENLMKVMSAVLARVPLVAN